MDITEIKKDYAWIMEFREQMGNRKFSNDEIKEYADATLRIYSTQGWLIEEVERKDAELKNAIEQIKYQVQRNDAQRKAYFQTETELFSKDKEIERLQGELRCECKLDGQDTLNSTCYKEGR